MNNFKLCGSLVEWRTPGNFGRAFVPIRTKKSDFRPEGREPIRTEMGQNGKTAGSSIRTNGQWLQKP